MFEDGDQVVIYAPEYNKALSTTKTGYNNYYNAGVDVTVAEGVVSGYTNAEVWTVTVNDDGTYTFTNGEYVLSLDNENSSLQSNGANNKWVVGELENGTYSMKNATREPSSYGEYYIEWYASKTYFTTYSVSETKPAEDTQFQFAFYIVPEGTSDDGSDEENGSGDETVTLPEGNTFVKVTETPADLSGTYLIVYEADALAYNGSLASLTGTENGTAVIIGTDNKIAATDTLKAATFTITKDGDAYTIKSASGQYIGNTGNSNAVLESTSTAYTSTITIDADGNANIVATDGGTYLRFNANSGQMRFRYYKSSTYTNQQPIALYKLVEE